MDDAAQPAPISSAPILTAPAPCPAQVIPSDRGCSMNSRSTVPNVRLRWSAVRRPWPPFSIKPGDPDRIRTCGPQIRNLMLYPAELRGQPSARNKHWRRAQSIDLARRHHRQRQRRDRDALVDQAFACSSVALPWTCSGSISPAWIARAVSANSSPTQRESLSISAWIAASLASGCPIALARHAGRHRRLGYAGRLAKRTFDQPGLPLLFVIGVRAEPGFEGPAASRGN